MLAAHQDGDFVAAEPRPRARPAAAPRSAGGRPAPARRASPPKPARAGAARALAAASLRLLGRGLLLAARQPLEAALAVAIAVAGGVIAWNALGVQTSKHPAPLFARSTLPHDAPLPPTRPAAEPAPTVTTPKPVTREPLPRESLAREAAPDRIGEPIRGGEPKPKPAEAPSVRPAPVTAGPKPAPVAPAPPAPRDAIGDLIRADAKPASEAKPAPAGPPRDTISDLLKAENPVPPGLVGSNSLVSSGQRALLKLGYGPLKADGVMGPGTRQAIERFERDRKLPVTGEFSGRTARELGGQSGIAIE